jgi:short-subunit dehydrogenase
MKDERDIAWVTGASQGIGRAIAVALAKSGRNVVVSARSEEKLNTLVEELRGLGVEALAAPCDVRNEDEIKATVTSIKKIFGRTPDILINNAGAGGWPAFSKLSIEEFDDTIRTNLVGHFICIREVLPGMLERGKGTIIEILSTASKRAYPHGAAYIASKHGALGMIESVRDEVRSKGVKVIGVVPGATETDIWSQEMRDEHRERMMQPEDVAQAVIGLLALPDRALPEELILRPIGGDL